MKDIYTRERFVFMITAALLAVFAATASGQALPTVCRLRGTLGITPALGATGTLSNGITRPGTPSGSCSGVTIPNPFNDAAGGYRYNVHYLKNPTVFAVCVPVRLVKTNPSSGADLQLAAFQLPFAAGDITNSARFRGDAGASTGAASSTQPTTFNIVVPGNSSIALVVYNRVSGSAAAEPYDIDFCTRTTRYAGGNVSIPDNTPAGVDVGLPVTNSGRVTDVNFRFDTGPGACDATAGNTNTAVTHTAVGDLVFRLYSPGGGFLPGPFINRRGGTRENICSVLIDDEGGFPLMSTITSQTGQFVSGNYSPEQSIGLYGLGGSNAQGTWTLNVSDNAAGDTGTLRRFSLEITTAALKSPFDYDGDRRSDISIYRPSVGQWWVSKSTDAQPITLTFGLSTDRIVPGDYTGDGASDIAVWRPSTGEWFILRSEDYAFYGFPFGANGDIPVPADYDGDTFTDPAVFRPSVNAWYVFRSTGGFGSYNYGASGDKPLIGDFDGDGKSDLAVFRQSGANGGRWFVQTTGRGFPYSLSNYSFGQFTDKLVPGDYTGDGITDVAVWRPSNGTWYINEHPSPFFQQFAFGTNGDIPIPGDYDGDGIFDAAVYRPSTGYWYVRKSTGGIQIQQFGTTGDIPTPSAFVP
jgi:subtilisin-like proprotein convertase family protein